ncbi:MAG: signal peptidase II [Actinomycetota bacterium]|nr:signal peptidase II [Actinomycetota bacterium]
MQAARGASLNHSGTSTPDPRLRSRRRHIGLFVTVGALAYVLDVTSKILAVDLLTGRPPVEVVGPYLRLAVAYNPGAAFSVGTSFTEILTAIAILAAGVVLWVARRLGSTGWAIGLGFLLGGVCGNLTDRLFRAPGPMRGHVVDFLMFPHFPVFNVADICINIAAATIIVQAVRGVRVDGRRHEADTSTGARKP